MGGKWQEFRVRVSRFLSSSFDLAGPGTPNGFPQGLPRKLFHSPFMPRSMTLILLVICSIC